VLKGMVTEWIHGGRSSGQEALAGVGCRAKQRRLENVFYTPDATALSSDGTWRRNRQDIEKITADLWTSTYKGATYHTIVESVRSPATNVMLADTTFEIRNIPGGGVRQGGEQP
jgi:hypothetical protein